MPTCSLRRKPEPAEVLRTGLGSPAARCATLLVAAAIVLNALGHEIAVFDPGGWELASGDPGWQWIAAAAVYVLAMALPFVPGIEIGVALMLLLGDTGVVVIYLCTQLALTLSFLAGRLVPTRVLVSCLSRFGTERARRIRAALEDGSATRRLESLAPALPSRWGLALAKHRYIALAIGINLPGNALLGGAGGLGLIAGASRLFSLPRYCASMALATSPVPVAMLLCGGA